MTGETRPCICWTGPVSLHYDHCCFRPDSPDDCHFAEVLAAERDRADWAEARLAGVEALCQRAAQEWEHNTYHPPTECVVPILDPRAVRVIRAALAIDTEAADLMEQGRRLAGQRDDLIAAGAHPADLEVPLAPRDTEATS